MKASKRISLVTCRAVILCISMICTLSSSAQTPNFNELFKQKKTQIRYLVEQIAALQVYLGKLKEGYEIVNKGLTTIGNIKEGKFSMDKTYIGSLQEVSPIIASSPLLDRITWYNRTIRSEMETLEDEVNASDEFTDEERIYIASMHTNITKLCVARLDELTFLTTPAASEMTHDERLTHLERIHDDFKRTFLFTADLVQSTQLLGRQRAKERQAINVLRKLHGVEL